MRICSTACIIISTGIPPARRKYISKYVASGGSRGEATRAIVFDYNLPTDRIAHTTAFGIQVVETKTRYDNPP